MEDIVVDKDGTILNIVRDTEIPFEAMELSEFNTMFPDEAYEQVFEKKKF